MPTDLNISSNAELTVSDYQKMVDRWITTVGVRYFSPLTNMAVLTEEVGEVARIIARLDGDQSFKPGESPDLADELADLLWVVAAIANQHDIDLTQAVVNNFQKKSIRDKERHRANEKLRDGILAVGETDS